MAKKKDKPQIINNIGELNLEIDYDKLADAIVKAQEKSVDVANTDHKFTSGTFALIISLTFRGIAIFGWLIMLVAPFVIYNTLKHLAWNGLLHIVGYVLGTAIAIIWLVVLFLYCLLLWKSAKEVEAEKDRNYIVSVFSGIVSFAALVVALVALFKG